MLPIIGLSIVVLGVVGVMLYASIGSFSSVERQAAFIRNIQRMDQIVSTLASSQRLAGTDGRMSLPAPSVENGIPALPTWLGVERRTPWGELYTYCVFAETPADGGDPFVAGRRMAIAPVSFPATGSRDYVVRSDRPSVTQQGLRALLLSGSPASPQSPGCDEVSLDNGVWRVARGTARVVYEQVGGAFGLHVSAGATGPAILYVSNDADTPEGRTGASPDESVTFSAALAAWQSARAQSVTLRLLPSPTPYVVPAGISDLTGAEVGSGRSLRIESAVPAQLATLSFSSLSTRAQLELADLALTGTVLAVDGPAVSLRRVALNATLRIAGSAGDLDETSVAGLVLVDGARVTARRSVLQAVRMDGADLLIGSDTNVVGAGVSAVIARGSRISVSADDACSAAPFTVAVTDADPAVVPGMQLLASELQIAGRDVWHHRIAQSSSFVSLDASSRLSVSDRYCGGALQTPRLRELDGAIDVGPIQSLIPPFFDPISQVASCDANSGTVCQVEAVCPAGRNATRGECGINQVTGSLVLLRRFGYASGDRFFCEMARPVDAEAVVSATAMCQR